MSGTVTESAFDFGALGDASRLVAIGWSPPEPDCTWTLGEESLVLLERPQTEADYILQVSARPFLVPGRLEQQRVHVFVNGRYLGKELRRNVGTFEMRVGWELIRAHTHIALTLLLPDAASPAELGAGSDTRRLGVAVSAIRLLRLRGAVRGQVLKSSPDVERHIAQAARAAPSITATMPAAMPFLKEPTLVPAAMPETVLDLALAEQMLEFESIGTDAEFGLVQRRAGAEPLGLLRFAEASLEQVVAGLEAGFDGIGAAGTVDIRLRGREFLVHESRYGLVWHSWTYEGQANPREVLIRETARLDFLRSKLVQDLELGHKLLVFKRAAPLAHGEIELLLAALGRHGSSQLLLVQPADPAHPDGSAERVGPRLLRGYVARFGAAEGTQAIATESWLAMARAAHRIWQGQAPR